MTLSNIGTTYSQFIHTNYAYDRPREKRPHTDCYGVLGGYWGGPAIQ